VSEEAKLTGRLYQYQCFRRLSLFIKVYLNYNQQAVVPSVAWDFLFDKRLPNLTYQTYLPYLTFPSLFFLSLAYI
jgi:hypothetical protein